MQNKKNRRYKIINKNLESLLNKSVILKEEINKYLESQDRKNLTIRELNILWNKFENDYISSRELVHHLWYDWFCEDSQLFEKGKNMLNIISKINNEKLLDNTYVIFKNNFSRKDYDNFLIYDIDSRNMLYWISLEDPYSDKLYSIYKYDFWEDPLLETNRFEEIAEFLNTIEIKELKWTKI